MKILTITPLAIPDAKIIRIARFADIRGYFTETMRGEDLAKISEIPFFSTTTWHQMNESYSIAGVVRGLHFQWNPHQGKLVRATEGKLVDLALDIRENSPTLGKIVGYELHYDPKESFQDLLWLPPGFAHGFVALTYCRLEYMCTGIWSPTSERAIRIFDPQIDWSIMEANVKAHVDAVLPNALMADKDRNGLTLAEWQASEEKKMYIETLI